MLKQIQASRVELCAALKSDDVTFDQIERYSSVKRLDAVISALTELVEADREYDMSKLGFQVAYSSGYMPGEYREWKDCLDAALTRFKSAEVRRAAALASFKDSGPR